MMVCDRFEDNGLSPGQSAPVLKASAILKRLSGGLHTVLVKASDGFLYVVRMMDSFQGPNVLANEALGNELAKYLGISVPTRTTSPLPTTRPSPPLSAVSSPC